MRIYKGRSKAKEWVVAADAVGRVLASPVFTSSGESSPVLQSYFHAVLVFVKHPGAHSTLFLISQVTFSFHNQ